jgi:hypothetical protein
MPPQSFFSKRSILIRIIFPNLRRLHVPSDLFLSRLHTKSYNITLLTMHATYPACQIILDIIVLIYMTKSITWSKHKIKVSSYTQWPLIYLWRYSSIHSQPQHWMEVNEGRHMSATLCPGKESPVPIGYVVTWAPVPVWTLWRRGAPPLTLGPEPRFSDRRAHSLVTKSELPSTLIKLQARTVFARSNIGIVGSNPTRGMDVCVRLFCVCVVLCVGSGLATGWSHIQGVLPSVYILRNWKRSRRPQWLWSYR